MQGRLQTIAETQSFLASAGECGLDEEVRDEIKIFLATNPLAGDLIPATGGLRKLRWSQPGMGRRGGSRLIYYFHSEAAPLYLLLAYAKSARTDLTAGQKKRLAAFAAAIDTAIKSRGF